MLTGAPNVGKVANRDALVKEVCWLTGTSLDASIPPSLRRNPSLFFAMWENLRSKAQKMISKPAAAPKPAVSTELQLLSTADAADALAGKPDPGLTEAGGPEGPLEPSGSPAKSAKFMLASLIENDKIVKTKRMSVPVSLSSLKTIAVSTFDLPKGSDLVFEVLPFNTKDMLAA